MCQAYRREFLHADDLADAILYLLHADDAELIVNIGWGEDVTIRALADLILSAIGYSGQTYAWFKEHFADARL